MIFCWSVLREISQYLPSNQSFELMLARVTNIVVENVCYISRAYQYLILFFKSQVSILQGSEQPCVLLHKIAITTT